MDEIRRIVVLNPIIFGKRRQTEHKSDVLVFGAHTYFSTAFNLSSFTVRLPRLNAELIFCRVDCLKALDLVVDSIYFARR